MRAGIRSYAVLLLLLYLTACGPAAKLRRAEKLIAKAEELGAKWRVDSVTVEIPVPVQSVRVDTVERVLPGDSIILEKERLKVVIKRLPGDTIMVWAECRADTIKVRVTKTVTKTISAKGGLKWWWLLVAGAVGVLLASLVRLIK
jgi:hypothetical protein